MCATGIIKNGKYIHDIYQDEKVLLDSIAETTQDEVRFFTESKKEIELFNSFKKVTNWIDNSKNTNDPPDFLNYSNKIMMDFMIINNYIITSKSGKTKNLPAKDGDKKAKEIKNHFPHLFDTPTNVIFDFEDTLKPDINQYLNNIKRVVNSHKKQIPKYKSNHPECKSLCFGICDTSENELFIADVNTKERKSTHPCDFIEIIEIIKNCGADFVLWFSPYISPPNGSTIKLLVIDVSNIKTK